MVPLVFGVVAMVFNCQDYPLNVTLLPSNHLMTAVGFGLDKLLRVFKLMPDYRQKRRLQIQQTFKAYLIDA